MSTTRTMLAKLLPQYCATLIARVHYASSTCRAVSTRINPDPCSGRSALTLLQHHVRYRHSTAEVCRIWCSVVSRHVLGKDDDHQHTAVHHQRRWAASTTLPLLCPALHLLQPATVTCLVRRCVCWGCMSAAATINQLSTLSPSPGITTAAFARTRRDGGVCQPAQHKD